MAERFADWVWEDPARSADLPTYNRIFGSVVLRSYDDVELSLPGLAPTFAAHPHQLAAVARVIAEPAVWLWHEVGAGKTAEMAMAAMELRRLGLVRKPAIVVAQPHARAVHHRVRPALPRGRMLAASSEDLTGDKRRRFVAKATTGDWDAVIITQNAFEPIPISPQAQRTT